MITSFGPGATIDLPDYSVIIGGLDWWPDKALQEIPEARLQEVATRALGLEQLVLLKSPPVDDDTKYGTPLGVQVAEFPLWFVAEHVVPYRGGAAGRLSTATA